MSDRRPLATPEQVGEYLGKPAGTLRMWRYRGTGPRWLKVGQRVRYRWGDIEKWLDQQASGGTAA